MRFIFLNTSIMPLIIIHNSTIASPSFFLNEKIFYKSNYYN